MQNKWNPNFIRQSSIYAPLTNAYVWQPNNNWPSIADYNQQFLKQNPIITNSNGQPIRCIEQTSKSTDFIYGYEPSLYLRGELLTRANNWHDFFNLQVWLTFPKTKAAINHWQYQFLSQRTAAQTARTPSENILTHLDENGVIVVSSDNHLIELFKNQVWLPLFWQQRNLVKTQMRFFVLGHALYEKALNPYIGMTGSAITLLVPPGFFAYSLPQQLSELDKIVSQCLGEQDRLAILTKLFPIPVLGIPGWWPANEARSFYENTHYFRAKRTEQK